jgi:hypothetical protein
MRQPISILAHRANLRGPEPDKENSLALCREALELGFGLETDLRKEGGRFYIAHDPQPRTAANDFEQFAGLFGRYHEQVIAMNVKELGYEADLIELQRSGQLGGRSFYFDFELLEPGSAGAAQRKLRALPGGKEARIAARLSDRGEPLDQCLGIPADVVWADEFDRLWLTREHVEAVHAAGREFFAISPELHGFSEEDRQKRWNDFKEWGIDGLCTDFALSARTFFLG